MALPQVASELQPKIVRFSKDQYWVTLVGFNFAEFRTRSEARICARDLYRVLRRLSSGLLTEPVEFANALQSWFSQAVSVPGLVVPPPIIST